MTVIVRGVDIDANRDRKVAIIDPLYPQQTPLNRWLVRVAVRDPQGKRINLRQLTNTERVYLSTGEIYTPNSGGDCVISQNPSQLERTLSDFLAGHGYEVRTARRVIR